MIWLQGILAVVLLAGAIYGWVLLQRKFKGESGGSPGGRQRRRKDGEGDNELEAFITAYREGKIDPMLLATGDDGVDAALASVRPASVTSNENTPAAAAALAAMAAPAAAPTAPAPVPTPAAPAPAPIAPAPTGPIAPGTLLRPEVKLAYLTFRSGLRDHHVFPNVRLGDLGFGVAVGTVDLLVCNSDFKYVAAVDVYTGEKPDDRPKSMFLSRAGINHLMLSIKAMPRPAQLRELIYGKPSA
ncbi:MAG: hypothetical protein JSU95_08165 [Betaproteobacteria bacterium]|nr:MAG: hypothetical protein JSU95_08165 [Betaproteobacteria bacterium]